MKFCHREKRKEKRNQIKFIKYTHRPHALYGIIANKNFKFQNALGQRCVLHIVLLCRFDRVIWHCVELTFSCRMPEWRSVCSRWVKIFSFKFWHEVKVAKGNANLGPWHAYKPSDWLTDWLTPHVPHFRRVGVACPPFWSNKIFTNGNTHWANAQIYQSIALSSIIHQFQCRVKVQRTAPYPPSALHVARVGN